MSSSIRRRASAALTRDSVDSGNSQPPQDAVQELKDEFRRSLINTERANSIRNLRPSEIAVERLKMKKNVSSDADGESDIDADVEVSGMEGEEAPSGSESHGSSLLADFLGGDSSDEEEDAEDAAALLKMPIEDSKEIKYVFKRQRGQRWYRRKAVWVWAFIVIAMGLLVAAGVVHLLSGGLTAGFEAWRLCFFLASIPLCYLGAIFLTFVTVKLVEKTFITKPSFLYIVYSIRRSLKLLLVSLLILISWACFEFINNNQSQGFTTTASWVLRAMAVVTLFLLAQLLKRMIAKMIGTILTGSNQRERMERALKHEKLLAAMMAARPYDTGSFHSEVELGITVVSNSDVKSGPPSEAASPTKRGNQIMETISSLASGMMTDNENDSGSKKRVTPLQRAQQLERLNRLEKYLRKKNLQVTLRDQLNQIEAVSVNLSTYQRLGQFLFYHLTHDMDATEVTREDIRTFMTKEKDVDAAFEMLDFNGDGKVVIEDCVQSLERVYFERANLANTLRDNKSINKVLEFLIGAVIHTIFVFFYLLILRQNVSQLWLGFSGLVVAFSFIFSNTASAVFENAIFVFAVHAYDVGDTLLIDNQWLTVDEITMNFTVCVSGYNLRVYYPNQALMRAKFVNLSTSLNKWEVIYVYVDADTDPSILDKIEEACHQVRNVEHKGEYGPGFRIKFGASEPPFKVGLEMVFEYSHQGINFHRTACARSWMYETFLRVLVENGITYTWPQTQGNDPTADSSIGGRGPMSLNVLGQQQP